MSVAALSLVLVLGGAFLAASLTGRDALFSLAPQGGGQPDVFQESQRVDLHRTFFTAWATLILLTPALCTFFFRRSSERAARYWRAFWTVSLVAFLVHFYWAVFVMFGNDWGRILQAKARVSAPVPDTIVTVWWVLDVLLAWLVRSENLWIRIQRALVHLAVFILFFLGSAREGELLLSRALGIAMGVAVLISFLIWVTRRLKKPGRGVAPAT
jgi:hypothetical protein